MKNKIFIILLIVISIVMTGCTSSKPTAKESIISIGDYKVELNEESKFNKLTFRYPKDSNYGNYGTFALIELNDNNDLVVRIALSYYEGKTVNQFMKDSKLKKSGQIKYNNINWTIYEGTLENGNKIINYVSEISRDGYSVTFESNKDINNFVKEFMNSVYK